MSQAKETRKERLQLLLDQLQIPDDGRPHFQDGYIEKLAISKEQKIWHFFIRLERLLPAEWCELFKGRLAQTFRDIANARCSFAYANSETDETVWRSYWPLIANELARVSPPLAATLQKQAPTVNDNKLSLIAQNEAEAEAIRRKLADPFKDICGQFGLPVLPLQSPYNNHRKPMMSLSANVLKKTGQKWSKRCWKNNGLKRKWRSK